MAAPPAQAMNLNVASTDCFVKHGGCMEARPTHSIIANEAGSYVYVAPVPICDMCPPGVPCYHPCKFGPMHYLCPCLDCWFLQSFQNQDGSTAATARYNMFFMCPFQDWILVQDPSGQIVGKVDQPTICDAISDCIACGQYVTVLSTADGTGQRTFTVKTPKMGCCEQCCFFLKCGPFTIDYPIFEKSSEQKVGNIVFSGTKECIGGLQKNHKTTVQYPANADPAQRLSLTMAANAINQNWLFFSGGCLCKGEDSPGAPAWADNLPEKPFVESQEAAGAV